jgi:hypothetical protein
MGPGRACLGFSSSRSFLNPSLPYFSSLSIERDPEKRGTIEEEDED